ncbi:hypothetical protein RSK60_1640002 [Ralstonia solanacearum K60]|nr:hypothetical protein RSK60_1640002 [Ralstonia solanacearum K60]
MTGGIGAMHLKDILGKVNANDCNRVHFGLLVAVKPTTVPLAGTEGSIPLRCSATKPSAMRVAFHSQEVVKGIDDWVEYDEALGMDTVCLYRRGPRSKSTRVSHIVSWPTRRTISTPFHHSSPARCGD